MPTDPDTRDPSPVEGDVRPTDAERPDPEPDGSAGTSLDDTRSEPDLPPAPPPYVGAVDDPYNTYEDPYGYNPYAPETAGEPAPVAAAATPAEPPPPPPAAAEAEDEEEDEEGMLRMSFLEHLEELRRRIIHALAGLAVAFIISLTFSENLWSIVQEPASSALANLGYKDAGLVFTSPMESFSIIWVKLPLLVGIFLASPWLLFQVWSFIAPGLYKRERRFAAPFIICSAGLFILGGLFAYFVAFRFGLTFLLGIGREINVRPMITISEYFDIFVNVTLGIAVVFELPILIFFLTLLRIASPRFLITNARYAVLLIVVLAAVITPTPDVINLMLFSVPMVLLYFVGVFASYILVLTRENRRFPWVTFLLAILIPLGLIAAGVYLAITRYGYHLMWGWPFLSR